MFILLWHVSVSMYKCRSGLCLFMIMICQCSMYKWGFRATNFRGYLKN